MEKKVVIVILVVILVIAVSVYFTFKPKYYAEDPRGWIEEKADGTKEVNITKATRGAGLLNPEGLQYSDGKVLTAFGYDGAYEGEYFSSSVYKDILSGNTLLDITPELKPGNGVMEGFIIEYIKGNEVTAYIFVDEDWRQKLGDSTNIIWGRMLDNIKKFEYTPIADGIYMNEIIDDPERFIDNYKESRGGILVGNLEQNNVLYDEFDGKTFIRLV